MQVIRTVLSQLDLLLQRFRSSQYRCPKWREYNLECGSILYGALVKQMDSSGLFPIPVAPYPGLKISALYGRMETMRTPVWYGPDSRHNCDLSGKVMAIATSVIEGINGLDLGYSNLD